MFHVLTQEEGNEEVLEEVLRWLNARVGRHEHSKGEEEEEEEEKEACAPYTTVKCTSDYWDDR